MHKEEVYVKEKTEPTFLFLMPVFKEISNSAVMILLFTCLYISYARSLWRQTPEIFPF